MTVLKGDWWVTDHRSRAYDLKEEIKAHGGQWHKDFGAWKLVGKDANSDAVCVLREAGLALEFIPGSERKYRSATS